MDLFELGLSELLDSIEDIIMALWNYIKHIAYRILRFTNHIVNFFKDPSRLRKIQQDKDIIAVTVKKNLDNGNYNTVNCLFDKNENTVVDMEKDAIGIESEYLDDEALRHFGDKDMIILN